MSTETKKTVVSRRRFLQISSLFLIGAAISGDSPSLKTEKVEEKINYIIDRQKTVELPYLTITNNTFYPILFKIPGFVLTMRECFTSSLDFVGNLASNPPLVELTTAFRFPDCEWPFEQVKITPAGIVLGIGPSLEEIGSSRTRSSEVYASRILVYNFLSGLFCWKLKKGEFSRQDWPEINRNFFGSPILQNETVLFARFLNTNFPSA